MAAELNKDYQQILSHQSICFPQMIVLLQTNPVCALIVNSVVNMNDNRNIYFTPQMHQDTIGDRQPNSLAHRTTQTTNDLKQKEESKHGDEFSFAFRS
jgi:hypothetical protein